MALMFMAGGLGYWMGRPDRPGPGSADVGFLQDMIVHHEQAVAMSYAAIEGVTDREVRGFAKDILTAQQYEIGLMDGWLRRWDQPREDPDPLSMEWAGHKHPQGRMPGMATSEELEAQAEATGTQAEEEFLHLMIRHHQGGVQMAEAALERASDDEVLGLAELIVAAQRSEIGEMSATLERLGLPPATDIPGYESAPDDSEG
ncbi:MAG: DUF305 domain-containing protein [Acidimicrobiia bacterium]